MDAIELIKKAGELTTEYKVAKSNGFWGVFSFVIGSAIVVGTMVMPALQTDSKASIIAGGVIAALGILQKTLVGLGYVKSRTEVKVKATEVLPEIDG